MASSAPEPSRSYVRRKARPFPKLATPRVAQWPSTSRPRRTRRCAASLIGYAALPAGDRALLTTAYPTNDREPQAVELDEEAQAAIAAAGPGKEVKDPLDYAPESHEVCANARFAIATNESARAELGLQAELKDALYKQAMLKKADDHTAANQRVASAKRALEATTQSSELRPDKVALSFNHTAMEWHFAYFFTNRSGLTASVACELPRLEGTTLANTFVTIDGYADESKYEPIKKAEETFKKLNASASKGACLQAVNKQAYAQTVKVPGVEGRRRPAGARHLLGALCALVRRRRAQEPPPAQARRRADVRVLRLCRAAARQRRAVRAHRSTRRPSTAPRSACRRARRPSSTPSAAASPPTGSSPPATSRAASSSPRPRCSRRACASAS